MSEKKYFSTVENEISFQIKIQHSVFIAHIESFDSFENVKKYINEINLRYKDASHNCWAYIIGKDGENSHSSDDGEPSGTAGKPILNILKKYKMTNTVAVVTRYYGGVKLGVRGLIDAYSQSVEECILNNNLKLLIEMKEYKISLGYDIFETVKYNLKSFEAEIFDLEYSDTISFKVKKEKDLSQDLDNYLNELQNSNKIMSCEG